jgi:gamma-glutamylcyclotransferase (GGCT)/AIG2-like uncharacterized protein YtfP
MTEKNQQLPLFVYGTLQPGFSRYPLIRQWVKRYHQARLSGFQMYDFRSFPGILPMETKSVAIPGSVLIVEPSDWPDFIKQADKVENEGFLFQRTEVLVDLALEEQLAWTYVADPQVLKVKPDMAIAGNDWAAVYR